MSGTAKINASISNEKYAWRPYWALTIQYVQYVYNIIYIHENTEFRL